MRLSHLEPLIAFPVSGQCKWMAVEWESRKGGQVLFTAEWKEITWGCGARDLVHMIKPREAWETSGLNNRPSCTPDTVSVAVVCETGNHHLELCFLNINCLPPHEKLTNQGKVEFY